MEKITKFLKKVSEENGYEIFIYDKNREIWVSGYIDGTKFDLVVKPFRKHQVFIIFEKPEERRVALFSNKIDAYRRLKKIFSEEKETTEETASV
ncbi:hypothetical protein [Persephonella atlantica]|uniref:hypothetical protein n=1 Tax=Persephonella atlantica TaxID=2699429 RepID=UPI00190D8E16|nr:hypothetical protein [Persephonella atlantica]